MASDSGIAEDSSAAKDPQQTLNEFWDSLITKKPGKVTSIFPPSLYANLLPPRHKKGPAKGKNAAESYEAAAEECRNKVKRIVRECNRTNEKFTDPDFDIEGDFRGNCLKGLLSCSDDNEDSGPSSSGSVSVFQLKECLSTLNDSGILASPMVSLDMNFLSKCLDYGGSSSSSSGEPGSVHRVEWIYENPSFVVDGYSSSDVRQGRNGDCWWIAAVATLCSLEKLMDKVCVARDEECGVYGFVFHRDGEWVSTVIDDNLYLTNEDFDVYGDTYDASGEKERKYKKDNQTGSDALYFAKCADPNEIWLPLLEKAYAKVHGDYEAIEGGISGEAVEDMTGGVTTNIMTNKILSKERLWKELLNVNKQFIFAASSPWLGSDSEARRGLALSHAYSILKAVEEEDEEGNKVRLVLIRNPWGKRAWNGVGEWNGPWSDGSKEWTPYWMNKLNHRFGDDGEFWMSYDDLRSKFNMLDRTRLFDHEWTVVQQWTSVNVSWVSGYLNTKFLVEIKKAGPTVFVLSQLDDRYFRGLEGQYRFDLHFLLQEEGADAGDHIVRARGAWFGNRSISAEVDLEPGRYEVLPKIAAVKIPAKSEVQDVVKEWAEKNPQKLRQIGMNYDLANAKGVVELTEEEKKAKEAKKKAEKEKAEKEKAEKEKAEKKKAKKPKHKGKKKARKEEVVEKKKDKPEAKEEEKEEESSEEEESEEDIEEGKEGEDVEGEGADESEDEEESEESEEEEEEEGGAKKTGKHKKKTAPAAPKPSAAADYPTPPEVGVDPDGGPSLEDADAAPQPAANPPPTEEKINPWNAVCVIGLRVYSKDQNVTIKLVKPKDDEEAAVLDADGATPAGATM